MVSLQRKRSLLTEVTFERGNNTLQFGVVRGAIIESHACSLFSPGLFFRGCVDHFMSVLRRHHLKGDSKDRKDV